MPKKQMITKALLIGLAGTAGLLLFYLSLVGLVSWSFSHALELLAADRYYVGAIASGFGLQLGLHTYHNALIQNCRDKAASVTTAAGTGTSTTSMIACCAHHVADFAPLIGSSGVAVFFNTYKYEMMSLGIAINLVGVTISAAKIYQHQKKHLENLEKGVI